MTTPYDPNSAVWSRLDEHTTELSALRERQAVTDATLSSLEARMDRQYVEVTSILGRIEAKQDTQGALVQQSRGGLKAGLWLFGAWTALCTLGVAFVAAVLNVWRG